MIIVDNGKIKLTFSDGSRIIISKLNKISGDITRDLNQKLINFNSN